MYADIGIVLCAASAATIAGALLAVMLRLRRLAEHARRIAVHPIAVTLATWRGGRSESASLNTSRLRAAVGRLRRANVNIARAAAASVRLGLDIDRVAFTVRLLLETFAPSLKGSVR